VAHPKMQSFTVRVVDPQFPAVKGLPETFEWTDECYFIDHLNADIHPVLVTDRTKLTFMEMMKIDAAGFPNPLPLAWFHEFDGGREFYLALGHNKEDYANPILYGIIENGILWTMKQHGELFRRAVPCPPFEAWLVKFLQLSRPGTARLAANQLSQANTGIRLPVYCGLTTCHIGFLA